MVQPQQKKKIPPISKVSIKHLENEVGNYLKDFQSSVKQIKETSLGLEELAKLLKSDEISENAYRLILNELGAHLSLLVDGNALLSVHG